MKKSELKELIMECMIEVMNDNYYNTYNDDEYYDEGFSQETKEKIKRAGIAAALTALTAANAKGIPERTSAADSNNKSRGISSSYSAMVDDVRDNKQNNVEFEIVDGVLKSAKYIGPGSGVIKITIPDGVTKIDSEVFTNDASLNHVVKIVLPEGLKEIGSYAFKGLGSLNTITIPDSVTSIGRGAFKYCNSLTSITIPDSVKYIDDYSFNGCTNLTNITIGDSVTKIGEYAFYECTNITNVMIPDSVTSIEYAAFYKCTGLTNITIPDSVTNIGEHAFGYCTNITNITIPDGITSISDGVFRGCTRLTSITIPDSVTSIGDNAFRGCTRLTSITIPESVTSIGERAFIGCSSLRGIKILSSTINIGDKAFYNCDKLEALIFSDYTEIRNVGSRIFSDVSNLTKVKAPKNESRRKLIKPLSDAHASIHIAKAFRVERLDKVKDAIQDIKHDTWINGERELNLKKQNNEDMYNLQKRR